MEEEELFDCDPPSVRIYRVYAVAMLGTGLSIVSLVCNLLIAKNIVADKQTDLAYSAEKRKSVIIRVLLRSGHSHFFFLALLALSDCFLSFMYGPVIAMDIFKDWLQSVFVTRAYLIYVGPTLALCQVSMSFSTYLIMLATTERYLITQRSPLLKSFRQFRSLFALCALLLSFLLKGTMFFEISVEKNGDCHGITEYMATLDPIVQTFWYGTFYRFYLRNICTVMVPFFFLAYLNYRIVRTLRLQQRSAELFRFLSSDHKTKIRSATRLLVFIVCSYLLANVLNVAITIWEFWDFKSTQEELFYWYEMCTDVVSVMYVFACATRLLVYYLCNKEIREAIRELICGRIPRKKFTVIQQYDSRLVGVGTQLDEVIIAIGRRLVVEDRSSPVAAIIYANKFETDSVNL